MVAGLKDGRWKAVVSRDERADGKFYYAVTTTGVYCRPSCGSRTARRENVRFFSTQADARAAGFRPCKRCKPDKLSASQQHVALVTAACRQIELSNVPPTLTKLAKAAGISSYHFHRMFKSITGVTPKEYATNHRTKKVQQALGADQTVSRAIYESGYNSNGRFYSESSKMLGMTPKQFKSGGSKSIMKYTVAKSSLGLVLVAATDKGICAITMSDDKDELVRDLHKRFPKADFTAGDKKFDQLVKNVVQLIKFPARSIDLPLDIQGTAFQQRVWQALQRIPAGTTASYSDIAKRLKQPKAVRAVASACARNNIAVVIPCHRVVHNDGGISGYRWGVERKKALLEREQR